MRIDNAMTNTYSHLATMKRINSAADDAAGLAISTGLTSQIIGNSTESNNELSMKDLTQTADGALSSMNDSLGRIRELAVQASNGTNSSEDNKMIQDEINQLKSSISDTAQGTQFNTIKILDGTFTNKNISSNPSGTGKTMSIQNTSLQSLGIDTFDVTGSFDISDIDNAISKVSSARSNLGSVSNGIQYDVDSNSIAGENLTSAESQISDLDVAAMMMQLKTQQMIQQYQTFAQQKTMDQKSGVLSLLQK